uniref:Uncharacterized protein orf600 n=1 Tax=Nyctotherus ovalis TaxID=70075 RepID=F1AAJ2_NYCOV|nr:hypothetical protein [Nyctotherus ovalis]
MHKVHHIVWPREVYTQLCKYCLKFLYGFGGEISQLRVGLLKELTLTGGFLIQDLYTMTKWRDFIRQDTVTARALSDSVYNTQHLASAQLLKIASYTKETDLMFWNPQQTADNGVEIFNHKKLTVYSQRTKVEEVYSFPYKNRQLAALTGILIFYDYEYLPRTIGKHTWAEIIYIRYIRAIYTGDYDFAEELLDHYHMMVADFEAHRLSFKRDSFEILDSLWALVNFCRWEILWGFVQSSYLDEYHTPTLPINGPAVKLPTIQTLADLRITVITAKQPVHENVGERVFINTPICATNTEYTSYMRHVAAQKKSGVDTYWLRYYNTLADIVRTCGWFIKKTPEHAMLQIQTTLENYGLADILLRLASLSWQTLQYEGFPVHSQADGLTTNISKTLATQNPQKIVIGQYLLESAPIYKALLLTPITTVLKLTHHQKFKDFLYFWQQGTTTVRTVAREIDQRVNLATAAIVSRTNPIAITTTQYYKYNIDIATITQVYYINTFYTTIYQPTVEYSLDFTENMQAIISPFYGLINFINFFSNYYNVQVVDRIINFTTGVIELVKNTRHVRSVLAGQSTVVHHTRHMQCFVIMLAFFIKRGTHLIM